MSLHFIRPEWLLLLLPLALLGLLTWRKQSQQLAWDHYIAPHLSRALISQSSEQKKHPVWLLAMAWFIAVLAASGPALTKQSLPVFTTEQGRVLVMDMSLSMLATDMSPNRLSQAKFRVSDLLNQLKEGETGLIAYAGDAFTISPLTRDTATLLNLLPSLSPDIMPQKGSDLAAALTLAQALLSQGGHIKGDIIVLTDGISATQFERARKALKNSRYRLSILALGSEQGAPIRLEDGQLLKDNSDAVIVAKTDYGLLQKLAHYQAGILVPAQADGSDLRQLQDWLAQDGDAKATELEGESWQDLGPYLALLLLIPCLLSFRHGLLPLIAVFCLYQPTQAQASVWDDLWQTRDQQGLEAFTGQDFSAAAEHFEDPLWRASAQYKAGEFQQALEGFEKDNSANGLYNQANALMQLGKNTKAIKRYQQALALQPDFPAAMKNLAIAEKAKQAQKQAGNGQGKQDGDSEDTDNDNQNESGQGSGNKSAANSDDGQGSEQTPSASKDESAEGNANEQQTQTKTPEQDKSGSQNQGSSSSGSTSEPNSDPNADPSSNPNSSKNAADASSGADDSQQTGQGEATDSDNGQDNTEDGQQNGSQAQEQDNQAKENDAKMQADIGDDKSTQATAPSPANASSAKPTAVTKAKQATDNDTKLAPTQVQVEALPADMERALRSVSEDPQVLLRNKMQLEYLKRRQQAQPPEDNEQW